MTYGDADDKIDYTFVATQMPRGAWDNLDRSLLRCVIRRLAYRKCSIDVGAGTGRLLDILSMAFSLVYAIEPNVSRFRSLCARLEGNPKLASCTAINTELEFAPICHADFALCSHVIQHLPSNVLQIFLSSLAKQIVPLRGMVLLTTSVASESQYYITHLAEEPTVIAREVNLTEFDRYATNPAHATLPVRHFANDELVELFQTAGFALVWSCVYRPFSFEVHRPETGFAIRRSAADMAILLKRI